MNVRRNANYLSSAEKKAFTDAIIKFKNHGNPKSGRWYDTFVQWHQSTLFSYLTSFASDKGISGKNEHGFISYAHSCPAFYPWHRAILYLFEKDLQEVSGDPTMTIPYWDSTDGLGADSPVFQPDFLGGNGDKDQDWKVMDGPFASRHGKFTLNVKARLKNPNGSLDGDGCLRRAFGIIPAHPVVPPPKKFIEAGHSSLPTKEQVDPILEIETYDVAPWNGTGESGKAFQTQLEIIHGTPHLWGGGYGLGSFADLATSPNDPLFFLHHANVDRWFTIWQVKNSNPDYPVKKPIEGNIGQGFSERMVPYGRPISDFWNLSELGYEYDELEIAEEVADLDKVG